MKRLLQRTALPDTTLDFQEIASKGVTTTWSIKAFIRPDPRYYEEKEQIELATKWDNLTSASAHFFRFELHPDEKGVEIWIDGQYCGRMDRNVKLKTVTYQLPVGGAIKDIIAGSAKEKSLYLPLDVSSIAIPGVMKDAKLSLEPGEQKIKDIPIAVVPGWQNADVGAVKEKLGAYDLYFDAYLSRSRFTGMRESLLLSVPLAQYVRAWVLCAVEDDPAKDPVLTTRLKRFPGNFEGIGSAIADTTIALPHARDAAKTGVTEVGNVKYYINGKNVSVPLYLIEIPLKVGEIQDVLYQEKTPGKPIAQPYLDFEFVGKLDRPLQQLDKSHKPDPNSVSGVHIFGVTLEKGAVEMQVAPAMIGNSYMPGEKAEMSVTLRSLAPGV
ncbi:MAG: hypothetical protein WCP55_23775, partial [Lentisphaerota bacterium]